MKSVILALIPCLIAVLASTPSHLAHATTTQAGDPVITSSAPLDPAQKARDLSTIVNSIAPIPQEMKVRRSIAQATFCLPQNVLGTLFYGLLQLSGSVVNTAAMNEVTIIVTKARVGVSLGRYILLHESLVTENIVRHEYGHTLQGYKHGPFFLLLEGVVSFVQVTLSMISPTYADGYYDRWPENEASRLGGGA